MNDYEEVFHLPALLGELMTEIIKLKAETIALKILFEHQFLQQHAALQHPEQVFADAWKASFSTAHEQLILQHQWYQGYWKNLMGDLKPPSDG